MKDVNGNCRFTAKEALRRELLEMKERDDSTRAILAAKGELDDEAYHPVMKAVHEENNRRMKEIIREIGWPLESEVGEDGSEAAWLIVQHAVLEPEFQEECLALLMAAVEAGEAEGRFFAYLQDRILVRQGKPQIYGTQHDKKAGRVFPFPTENPEGVNERRRALGLWSQEAHTSHLQQDHDAIQANKTKRHD